MPEHDPDTCLFTVTTERFVPGTLVMLGTFLEHHPRFGGDVVIVHDGLPEALRSALAGPFRRVRFEPVSGELQARLECLAALPVIHNRLPNFYFLEAFRLGGYRKMLCFDSDLLFRAPIGELFDSEEALLCCRTWASLCLSAGEDVASTGIFNSGFLIMDGRLPGERCYADLLAMLSPEFWLDTGSPLTDQFVLNRYFAGRQTLVSSTYNYLLGSAGAIRAREGIDAESAKVLHFNLPIKPWMTDAMLHWLQGDIARASSVPRPAFGLWYDAYLRCLARGHVHSAWRRHKEAGNRQAEDGRGSLQALPGARAGQREPTARRHGT